MLADNPEAIDEKEITVYIFSMADPSICPPGTHTVMAIGPSLRSWPSPKDPAYRNDAYKTAKQEETERILDTLEKHFPGFRKAVKYHTLASPSTIERYTMKPGGAVAGPKQSMGQDLLQRPHASTKWKNLFMCGESTVMGTGSPAVTISGISAANMVLRQLGMKELEWRPDMKDTVIQLRAEDIKKRDRGGGIAGNALSAKNARDLHESAALCQWCEDAPCLPECPYGIDIRGALRRIEMGNLPGALKVILQRSDKKTPDRIRCLDCSAPCVDACAEKGCRCKGVPIASLFIALEKESE